MLGVSNEGFVERVARGRGHMVYPLVFPPERGDQRLELGARAVRSRACDEQIHCPAPPLPSSGPVSRRRAGPPRCQRRGTVRFRWLRWL
eukprot:2424830-Rhodomonas_salina.1